MKTTLIMSGFVLVAAGCSTNNSASPAALQTDPVSEVRTVVHLEEGPEDLGVIKWRASAEDILRDVPMSAYAINDEGYLVSFTPAFPPIDGVSEPSANVTLKYLRFNAAGRMVGWEAYGAEENPSCGIQKIVNPPNPPTYQCIAHNCVSPNECVVQYILNPDGTFRDVYCDCTSVP